MKCDEEDEASHEAVMAPFFARVPCLKSAEPTKLFLPCQLVRSGLNTLKLVYQSCKLVVHSKRITTLLAKGNWKLPNSLIKLEMTGNKPHKANSHMVHYWVNMKTKRSSWACPKVSRTDLKGPPFLPLCLFGQLIPSSSLFSTCHQLFKTVSRIVSLSKVLLSKENPCRNYFLKAPVCQKHPCYPGHSVFSYFFLFIFVYFLLHQKSTKSLENIKTPQKPQKPTIYLFIFLIFIALVARGILFLESRIRDSETFQKASTLNGIIIIQFCSIFSFIEFSFFVPISINKLNNIQFESHPKQSKTTTDHPVIQRSLTSKSSSYSTSVIITYQKATFPANQFFFSILSYLCGWFIIQPLLLTYFSPLLLSLSFWCLKPLKLVKYILPEDPLLFQPEGPVLQGSSSLWTAEPFYCIFFLLIKLYKHSIFLCPVTTLEAQFHKATGLKMGNVCRLPYCNHPMTKALACSRRNVSIKATCNHCLFWGGDPLTGPTRTAQGGTFFTGANIFFQDTMDYNFSTSGTKKKEKMDSPRLQALWDKIWGQKLSYFSLNSVLAFNISSSQPNCTPHSPQNFVLKSNLVCLSLLLLPLLPLACSQSTNSEGFPVPVVFATAPACLLTITQNLKTESLIIFGYNVDKFLVCLNITTTSGFIAIIKFVGMIRTKKKKWGTKTDLNKLCIGSTINSRAKIRPKQIRGGG
ncbi:hypothetical protein VP01_1149g1 [Puccinia sorghi]|uniref:Uncharacterized protein n=1 Tax=Puccinia sorghi TaxID=27349 RepID=A0A0L6VRS0_9BASI|nr:hypothetical protein VP01_1149g1 [Puccinia sorghi]